MGLGSSLRIYGAIIYPPSSIPQVHPTLGASNKRIEIVYKPYHNRAFGPVFHRGSVDTTLIRPTFTRQSGAELMAIRVIHLSEFLEYKPYSFILALQLEALSIQLDLSQVQFVHLEGSCRLDKFGFKFLHFIHSNHIRYGLNIYI